MRFLLYNIAYATGSPQSYAHGALTIHRYLRASRHHLRHIQGFIEKQDPDVVGLVELDTGSFRAGGRNHAAAIARRLEHNYTYCSKYQQRSLARLLPILRHQGNALFARGPLEYCEHHFLPRGLKRLVLEARIEGVRFFLVHLALNKRVRRKQLTALGHLVGNTPDPVILAGDFNAFEGARELEKLTGATGLQTANIARLPTYPSWQPRKELDFILCSTSITIQRFEVLDRIHFSDHLPLILDFSTA